MTARRDAPPTGRFLEQVRERAAEIHRLRTEDSSSTLGPVPALLLAQAKSAALARDVLSYLAAVPRNGFHARDVARAALEAL